MYRIQDARFLAPDIKLLKIEAPRIARKRKAGQFVIVRVHEHGERIPLTIADADPKTGTITIIVQGVGKTTKLINMLESGDGLLDVVGPLGNPSDVRVFGTVVVIGGGVGTAIAYPTAVAMKQAGNRVLSIVGARTKELLILENQMRATSDELFVTTDDGTCGQHGLVTQKLDELIASGQQIDHVLAIGPILMMQAVAEATKPHKISTTVSLNPIMVDGTGMCGGCRVVVGGESRFACVDGPEFDAHAVDFQVLAHRNQLYRAQERASLARFQGAPQQELELLHACRLQNLNPDGETPLHAKTSPV
jgi:ferredoxin--NADP+ reductase